MSSINKWVFSISFSIVIILTQIIITQWSWIIHLQHKVDVVEEAKRIEGDLAQDLMMQLSKAKGENLTIGSQQFVAGVLAATQNTDRYKEVWHAGYEQGLSSELEDKTSTYTGSIEINANKSP